jgi:plasmid stabilization system protein ParE
MNRRLVVRPVARLDIADASDWYDRQNKGLGDEFLHTVQRMIDSIIDNPLQYQARQGKARRASIGKFPFALIYTVSDDEVVIVSCFHGRRDPKRWQDRIPE